MMANKEIFKDGLNMTELYPILCYKETAQESVYQCASYKIKSPKG